MRERASTIVDLPVRNAPIVPAHLSAGAARKVAALKGTPFVLVESGGRLLGVADARALAEAPAEAEILSVVRPVDLGLRPTTPLPRARELMLRARVTALPVAAGAFLLGVVQLADVERALQAPRAGARVLEGTTRAVA